ncbi:MAG: universal stress protein [Microthrixaceae bacterium]|nr:universal stress protein [Microthrixaceae bacterium]
MSDLQRPDDWELPVALPQLQPPARIVVGFDGSHAAETALSWAEVLASVSGAEIIVVVAFEAPLTKRGRGATYVETLRRELRAEATELAEEATTLLLGRGRDARAVVIQGEPAAAIIDVVEDEEADLVVLGRRGLASELSGLSGAVERLRVHLGGSVAERIAQLDGLNVLVVG